MKILTFTLILTLCSVGSSDIVSAQSEIPTAEQQIQAAVSPAPEAMKENVKVLGYNELGDVIVLRQGTNELICLADNPNDERFHVACYHKDLEPFMKRGRELRAEGKTGDEIREYRYREIKEETLPMPEKVPSFISKTGLEPLSISLGFVIKVDISPLLLS